MKNKKSLALFALAVSCLSVSLSSCGNEHATKWKTAGEYTYQDYTTVSPSNWNELTYQDNNDTQIMSYIGSSFFTYDFKFDAQGNIVESDYEIKYSAASALEDVTATYAGSENYAVPTGATRGYAYKITLRDDLKWHDGTPIKAEDFVYTMEAQLDPAFKNYRADSFYVGSTIIHNAKEFAKQGDKGWFPGSDVYGDTITDLDGLYFDSSNVAAFEMIFGTGDMSKIASLKQYFTVVTERNEAGEATATVNLYDELAAYAGDKRTPMTKEISDKLASLFGSDGLLGAASGWVWVDTEIGYFSVTEYEYQELDFDKVGIFAASDYDLVVVLDKPLYLFKDDGVTLSYQAAYNFSSLPLVKKDLYEANIKEPASGSTLYTSTYNSSVESTASWGPYKLVSFQADKEYVLERNENWYGYGMDLYKGQYQTTRIAVETVKEWNTAWLKFQSGSVDGIGIDVSISADYKNSSRALFTPSDFVSSLQLQSSAKALADREWTWKSVDSGEVDEEGKAIMVQVRDTHKGFDKEMLAYTDFRKALSLSIDRQKFAQECTTASKAGFGLFNSMHYYDVENGKTYRGEDVAKEVLCDVYNVDPEDYDGDLTKAEAAVTGYNLAEAKDLVISAYDEALAAGTIKATENVEIEFGTGAINESVQRQFEFIKKSWEELVKATPLEGRLVMTLTDHSDAWATDFRAGGYEVCMGGWSGAAWDPGYFLLAYLSPDYMYSTAWETDKVMLTLTMPSLGGTAEDPAYDGEGETLTMSLIDWYNCLNGDSSADYNWAAGAVDNSVRLFLIAALEKEVLSVYYSVPLVNSYSASLLSYKVEYVTDTYNTFMGYGGVRYMTYNYDDAEWYEFVKEQKELDYTA